MERNQRRSQSRKKENPITILLVIALFIATLLTPFSFNTPEKQLARAWGKSRAELAADEKLQLIQNALWDGSFEAKGEHSKLTYAASLPAKVMTVEEGNIGNRRVAFDGDTFYLQSDTLGEAGFSAPRKDASTVLCDSAFSDAEMPALQMRFLRSALAASDADFAVTDDVLSALFAKVWETGKPELTSLRDRMEIDGKQRKVTVYTSEVDSEGLKKALTVWKNEGNREEVKAAYTALRRYLSATLSPTETGEATNRFVDFLCGTSSDFDDFEKRVTTADGRACITTTVYKGRVISAKFALTGSDFVLEAKLDLDAELRKNATWSASVSAKTEKKELFSLSLKSAVTENSDEAFIRKWDYAFNDTIGAITPDQGSEEGSFTFSWGKKKGDLGLKLLLGETELILSGTYGSYKEGQELKFTLNRMEYNGENLIEGDTFAVTVRPEGDPAAFGDATENLFPDGEERQEFADTLRVCFPWYIS